MAITPEQARAELARRELERRGVPLEVNSLPQQIGQNAVEAVQSLPAGMLPMAGVGAAAAINNKFIQPRIMQPLRDMNMANAELRSIGQQYGMDPKANPMFAARGLTDQLQLQRAENQGAIQNINKQTKMTLKELEKSLSQIDSNGITKSTAKISSTIKSKLPEVYKGTMKNYETAMGAVDELAEQVGFNMSNRQFTSNVIDKVIAEAEAQGIDPKDIKNLVEAKDGLMKSSKVLDVKGNPIGSNMTLSDAKSVISNLTKEKPYSPLSAKMREAWLDFLSKEAPAEVRPAYENINKNYKSFKEFQNFAEKLSKSKTGEFDAEGIQKAFLKYAQNKGDTGISNFVKLMQEGNELVPKIDGIGDMFGEVSSLKDQRSQLIASIKNAKVAAPELIGNQQALNLSKVEQIIKDRARANELANIVDESSAKVNPVRAITKAAFGKMKILSGLPMGIVQGKLEENALGYNAYDGMDIIMTQMFGSPAQKKALEERMNKLMAEKFGT